MSPNFTETQRAFIERIAEDMAERVAGRTAEIAAALVQVHIAEIKEQTRRIIEDTIVGVKAEQDSRIKAHEDGCGVKKEIQRIKYVVVGGIGATILITQGGTLIKAIEWVAAHA